MAIPITLLAKPIINILFGSGYLESVIVLRIYVWSSLGLFLGTVAYQFLITENKVKIIFIITVMAMVINIGLNLIFIPNFGLVGASWATLISYLVIPIGVFFMEKFKK